MKKILYLFVAMLVALAANAKVININSDTKDALRVAVAGAVTGDVIVMAEGTYVESNSDYIAFTGKNVTVMAEKGAEVIVVPQVPIRLKTGARAEFINIKFDCGHLSDKASYSEIIVPADGTADKKVILEGCEFYGWKQKSNAIIHTRTDRQLDSIVINNCYFHDNLYNCISLKYASVVGVSITNSTFANITTDASGPDAGTIDIRATTGPVRIDHCTFYNAQAKNTDYGAIGKIMTNDAIVSNCVLAMPKDTAGIRTISMVGGSANNCLVYNYQDKEGYGIASTVTVDSASFILGQDPLFVDAANGDLRISAGSPVLGAGTGGSDLGDPRWIPQINYYLIGNMNNWELNANYILEQNPENDAEYTIPMMMLFGDEFKITKSDGITINEANSYPSGVDKKYQVTASGEYTVRFRPDGQGGEGWLDGYLYAQPADLGPWEAWFGNAVVQEKSSYLSYDSATGKITAHIRSDKNTKAKIKYHGIAAEAGKCYRIAFKMKANRELNGITLIWQEDNTEPAINENRAIGLNEDEEFIYEEIVSGAAGNGILLFDFGVVSKGVIIEIYDVAIEEVECPAPPTYYLVGSMTDWAAQEEYKFTASESVEGEYILNTTLEAGCAIKVVGISEIKETWYPGGFDSEYVVDASHAGETTVYFRPAGNPEWTAFGGYFYMDAKQAIDHVEATAEQEKFIRDGQMYILIDGQVYNTLGQRVAQ